MVSWLMVFNITKYAPMSQLCSRCLFSPISSRPHTPKSDTEVDRQKSLGKQDRLIVESEDDTMWEWGDMPRKSPPTDADAAVTRTTGRGMLL